MQLAVRQSNAASQIRLPSQEKRKALLDSFFTNFDKKTLQSLLADTAQISGAGKQQSLGKDGEAYTHIALQA